MSFFVKCAYILSWPNSSVRVCVFLIFFIAGFLLRYSNTAAIEQNRNQFLFYTSMRSRFVLFLPDFFLFKEGGQQCRFPFRSNRYLDHAPWRNSFQYCATNKIVVWMDLQTLTAFRHIYTLSLCCGLSCHTSNNCWVSTSLRRIIPRLC